MSRFGWFVLAACILAFPRSATAQSATVDSYRKQLTSADPDVRLNALVVLGQMGTKANPAVAELAKFLAGDNREAEAAAMALSRIAPDGTAYLWNALGDHRAQVRGAAAKGLGYVRPRPTVPLPALRRLLSDKSDLVRLNAAQSLWYLREPIDDLVPTLCTLLECKDQSARAGAAKLVGRMGRAAKAAVPALAACLKSPNEELSENAARALLAMRPEAKSAIPAVLDGIARSKNGANKTLALETKFLGGFGPDTLPEFLKAIQHLTPGQRSDELVPLKSFGKNAFPYFLKALQHPDAGVRRWAAFALGDCGKHSVAALKDALKDPDEDVQFFAAWSLARVGAGAEEHVALAMNRIRAKPAEPRQVLDMLVELGRFEFDAWIAVGKLAEDGHDTTYCWRVAHNSSTPKGTAGSFRAALKSNVPALRRLALRGLLEVDPHSEATLAAIEPFLQAEDPATLRDALAIAGAAGPKAKALRAKLLGLLDDAPWCGLLDALVKVLPGDREILAKLEVLTTHCPREKRWQAVHYLESFGCDNAKLLEHWLALVAKFDGGDHVAELLDNRGQAAWNRCRKAMQSEKVAERFAAASILYNVEAEQPKARAILAAIMLSDNEDFRYRVPWLFSYRRDVDAVPFLEKALKDQTKKLRLAAVAALERLLPAGREALQTALADEDQEVRKKAIEALASQPESWPALVPLLVEGIKTGHMPWVLGLLDHSRLMAPPLEPLLLNLLAVGDTKTRWRAASILGHGRQPGSQVVPALVAALADERPGVRIAAGDSLSRLDRTKLQAIPALIHALALPDFMLLDDYEINQFPFDGPSAPSLWSLDRPWNPLRSLARFGDAAVPALLEALFDPALDELGGPEIHMAIAKALALMGEEANAALPTLFEATRGLDCEIGQLATRTLLALGEPGEDLVPMLMARLIKLNGEVTFETGPSSTRTDSTDGRPWLHDDPAYQLGLIGARAKAAVPLLRQLANDPDSAFRVTSTIALWRVTRDAKLVLPPALAILAAFLASPQEELVNRLDFDELFNVVAKIGPDAREAVPMLRRYLQSHERWWSCYAVEALAGIGPAARAAAPELVQIAKGPDFSWQKEAIWALWRIGQKVDAMLLLQRVKDLDATYAELLGEIGPPAKSMLPQLRKLMANGFGVQRLGAAEAICRIEQDPKNVSAVMKFLGDRDLDVRKAAAEALGRLGPLAATALPALREATDDPEVQVRNAARKALRSLGAGPREQREAP